MSVWRRLKRCIKYNSVKCVNAVFLRANPAQLLLIPKKASLLSYLPERIGGGSGLQQRQRANRCEKKPLQSPREKEELPAP